jgi:hypothetical protein
VRGGDGGLRVALLTGSGPKYDYLTRCLAERFRIAVIVREAGTPPRLRTRTGRARAYQRIRQRWTLRDRYRRRFFATASGPADPASPPGPDASSPGPVTVTVATVSDPVALAAIQAADFDIAVVCGTSLIRQPLLAALGCAVNLHAGFLPWYKGNHTVFFAYRDRAWDRLGSTIHLLDDALDGGAVIATVRPRLSARDSDEHLYCRAAQAGIATLAQALARIESGAGPVWATQQPGQGRMFRHRDRGPAKDLGVALARMRAAGRPSPAGEVVSWAAREPGSVDVRSLLAGTPRPPRAEAR